MAMKIMIGYELVIAKEEEAKEKANLLIKQGFRPWGSPSFINSKGSITCCQAFVKQLEVK